MRTAAMFGNPHLIEVQKGNDFGWPGLETQSDVKPDPPGKKKVKEKEAQRGHAGTPGTSSSSANSKHNPGTRGTLHSPKQPHVTAGTMSGHKHGVPVSDRNQLDNTIQEKKRMPGEINHSWWS